MKIKSNFTEIKKEYLLPLLLEAVILGVFILVFKLVVDLGPLVDEVRIIENEATSPTLGRLIYGIFSFFGFLVFTKLSISTYKKENVICSFYCGFIAGMLLWQAVGEIAWHFSVGGINFVQLESVAVLPFAVLFLMLLIYAVKLRSFMWGVLTMLLSFAANWYGHYVSLGFYPFVKDFLSERTWNVGVSLIAGIPFFAYSVYYLLFKANDVKTRLLASLMTFIALGVIGFGIFEG